MVRSLLHQKNAVIILAIWIGLGYGRVEVWPEGSRVEPLFDYYRNSYTLIGLKDYPTGTRIMPDNELLLGKGNHLRLFYGTDLSPLDEASIKTLQEGYLPIVLVEAREGTVQYRFAFYATPLTQVKNWKEAFDGPVEGENYLVWILVQAENTQETPAQARIKAEIKSDQDDKTDLLGLQETQLGPRQIKEFVFVVPQFAVEDHNCYDQLTVADAKQWLGRTEQWWREFVRQGAIFEVPCVKAQEALLASLVYQFIIADNNTIKPGEGFYDTSFLRDGAYIALQLEEMGFVNYVRRAIEQQFLPAQHPTGNFETQSGEFDANGQTLWTLWQFYMISRDSDWLEHVWPAIMSSVEWISRTRQINDPNGPYAGLLPNETADGEYLRNKTHHIVGYDFWNLRGLICAAELAQVLNKEQEAKQIQREAEDYRQSIERAWRQSGLMFFGPSWEMNKDNKNDVVFGVTGDLKEWASAHGTHWGNTEVLWPKPLFDAHDQRVSALIHEVRQFWGGGFIEGLIQWRGKVEWPTIHHYCRFQ